MARWSSKWGKNYLNVRLKGMRKSDPSPYFEISRGWNKQTKKPEEILSDENTTFIEWRLTRIEPESFEYEGRTIHNISLQLTDTDNNCLVFNASYTGIMKIWLLKLASAKSLWVLRFSVYCKDWKKRGRLTSDWEPLEMKYDWEKEIKPLTEWYPNGTSDDTKLIEFIEWPVLDDIRNLIPAEVSEDSEPELEEKEEEDNLPF